MSIVRVALLGWLFSAHVSFAVAADGVAAGSTAAVQSLATWLSADTATRGELAKADFARTPLSRDDAAKAADLLWRDHADRIKKTRADEMERRLLQLDGKKMPFWYQVYGDKPVGGRSLFISMHGGGMAPFAVNDQQWENQKRLYRPKEGVYLCPRAPTDAWNLWHQKHIDDFLTRLIENLVVFEDVNPNRVYLLGYSAGGDGVYQLAPRMADRWAAAAMMAGHPNDASPQSLRNMPFTIHVGGNDRAFNRNKVAQEWGGKLAELRKQDPQGYEHEVHVHAGKGHWMDREDAAAIDWMAKHTRNPVPARVVWRQHNITHRRFYWLAVDADNAKAKSTIIAAVAGQQITLDRCDVPAVTIRVSDQLLDLDQPVVVKLGEKDLFRGKVDRTVSMLATTLAERGDPRATFAAELPIKIPSEPLNGQGK